MAHSLPLRSAPTIVYFVPVTRTGFVLLPQPPLREKFRLYKIYETILFWYLQVFSYRNYIPEHLFAAADCSNKKDKKC